MVLDLDHFKEINDRFGHYAGDRALERLAMALRRETRSIDTIARLGGEEFAVLAPDADGEAACLLAERLRSHVKAVFADDEQPLTISCGVASYPSGAETAGDLLRAADRAIYAAKDLGRDRSVMYRPTGLQAARGRYDAGGRATQRVASLVALAEAVDRTKGSRGHSRAVERYSEALARELGLDQDVIERVAIAGLLHDVGTITVPDSIVGKRGRLTEEEWAEVRRHSEVGARMVATARIEGVSEWILAHHERPDGTGYPFGLAGEDIPLEARIIAVADAFAAMTMDRVYQPALPVEAAKRELETGAGTQFDGRVVEALIALESAVELGSAA